MDVGLAGGTGPNRFARPDHRHLVGAEAVAAAHLGRVLAHLELQPHQRAEVSGEAPTSATSRAGPQQSPPGLIAAARLTGGCRTGDHAAVVAARGCPPARQEPQGEPRAVGAPMAPGMGRLVGWRSAGGGPRAPSLDLQPLALGSIGLSLQNDVGGLRRDQRAEHDGLLPLSVRPDGPAAQSMKKKSVEARLTWWSSRSCMSAPELPVVLTSTTVWSPSKK